VTIQCQLLAGALSRRHAGFMGKVQRPRAAGLYHVAARSNAEEQIFRDDRDYVAGIHILADLVAEGLVACYQFCFMPTHYHLLGSFDEDALSTAIHRLNRRYATGFNRRHRRRGRVFDGPFAAVAVEDDAHFLWLTQYIADNPPRRPWPYSSADARFSFVSLPL
jgi:REP element-mobilizing transposase RayT